MVTRMIAIGEKSGQLEKMLSKVAEFYDEQVDTAVEGFDQIDRAFDHRVFRDRGWIYRHCFVLADFKHDIGHEIENVQSQLNQMEDQ
jgi:hypothetical protein